MLRRDIPLAPLTTLGVGGPAAYLAEVSTATEVSQAVTRARQYGLPVLALGRGSNLLVADTGVRAVVVRITAAEHGRDGDLVWADAGCPWDTLVHYAVRCGMAGIEFMSGIPGTAGAAAVQNIGAYAQQLSDTFELLEAVDLSDGSVLRMTAADCRFGYRSSIFTATHADRYLITRIRLKLRPGGVPVARHPDFTELPMPSTLAAVRAATLDVRDRKGMLAMPGRMRYRSAGSFFKNPLVDAKGVPPGAPAWPQSDGQVKVAAGWLCERAGAKGMRAGGAMVSHDHALCIFNTGTATAADIAALASTVQDQVWDVFGIRLEPEVRFWGFDTYPLKW